jgi:hypothetical protein
VRDAARGENNMKWIDQLRSRFRRENVGRPARFDQFLERESAATTIISVQAITNPDDVAAVAARMAIVIYSDETKKMSTNPSEPLSDAQIADATRQILLKFGDQTRDLRALAQVNARYPKADSAVMASEAMQYIEKITGAALTKFHAGPAELDKNPAVAKFFSGGWKTLIGPHGNTRAATDAVARVTSLVIARLLERFLTDFVAA